MGEEETPTMEMDVAVKSDTDTDSDMIIEPYMAQGTEYQTIEAHSPELALEETGSLVDLILWPPRVLDDQPLSLIMQQVRDIVSQPGLPGVVSLGVASIIIAPA